MKNKDNNKIIIKVHFFNTDDTCVTFFHKYEVISNDVINISFDSDLIKKFLK